MESKFTKGPWSVNGLNGILSNSGICVAIATKDGILNNETVKANAKAIAALPELLDALKDGVELMEYLINALPTGKVRNAATDWNIIARAALNKALD